MAQYGGRYFASVDSIPADWMTGDRAIDYHRLWQTLPDEDVALIEQIAASYQPESWGLTRSIDAAGDHPIGKYDIVFDPAQFYVEPDESATADFRPIRRQLPNGHYLYLAAVNGEVIDKT